MKYCRTCLQPDTRPRTVFSPEGLCPACENVQQAATEFDYKVRYQFLMDLIEPYRGPGSDPSFDCIMGVSGGKDSTRQALWARDNLGLNPLLACLTYPPEQVSERGTDNLSNLIELGFDVVVLSLGPQTWRRTVRKGFFEFTNWARYSEQCIISSVPQLAIRYGIRLILWGENPGLQLGDLATLGTHGFDGNNLRYMNTVGGGGIDELISAGFERGELLGYRYPSPDEFAEAQLQIIYLGWAWKDWSLIDNGSYSVANGLQVRIDSPMNTGDMTGVSSLDEDWVTLNQMIKYYKYGFGRVTDFVNEEVRHHRMSRDEAIDVVKEYDGACSDDYIESFCEYIGVTTEFFWEHVRSAVNRNLFEIRSEGKPVPRFQVGVGL